MIIPYYTEKCNGRRKNNFDLSLPENKNGAAHGAVIPYNSRKFNGCGEKKRHSFPLCMKTEGAAAA